MAKELDIEDEIFEARLADKRHKELTKKLGELTAAITSKDDKAIAESIIGQADKIGELVKAIQEIPKPEHPENPEIKVELNPQEFVTSVKEICKDIVASNEKVIEALENRLLPDTFILVKSYGGATESVKVNYKQANLIQLKNK